MSSDYERGRHPDLSLPDDTLMVSVPVALLQNCRAAVDIQHRSEALLGALDRWIADAKRQATVANELQQLAWERDERLD